MTENFSIFAQKYTVMPRRKHTKKNQVVARVDANQNVRESLKERARVAEAMQKKYEMLREQYEAEAKRKELMEKEYIKPLKTPVTCGETKEEGN